MRILGTGSALPAYTLTNEQLTQFLDTSDEWIRTRTGIQTRQVLSDETLLELAVQAAQRALEDAKIDAGELDYILCSTVQGDWVTPSMGCLIQNALKANCPAVDINGACAGFIYALDLADAYLKAGKAQKMLIISAEAMTRIVDWTDRSTCVLFGDGAGAAVVDAGEGMFESLLTSDGNAVPLHLQTPPGNSPFAVRENAPQKPYYLYMDGPEIYRFAVSHSAADLKNLTERVGIKLDQIRYFLLHQANKRILDSVRVRLKQPEEKFPCNIEKRGNCSSACIPILLDELNRAGEFKKGDLLAMSAFGAGLTTGACLLSWARD